MRVIIIGAGMSGAAAAVHLVQLGIQDVMILEASQHIGGRIHSSKTHSGNNFEFGATWIHGIDNNPVYKLASDAGLLKKPTTCNNAAPWESFRRRKNIKLLEDGSTFPYDVYREMNGKLSKALQDCDFLALQKESADGPDKSVEAYLREQLEGYMSTFKGNDLRLREILFQHVLHQETSLNGCHSMTKVSAKQIGKYAQPEGPEPMVHGGYTNVVLNLLKSIPQVQIKLKHSVTSINYSQEQVEVHCANNSVFNCDIVLVTTSLGHLKENHDKLFTPSLPAYKQASINKMGFGTVDKIFLIFENLDFLPKKVGDISLMWDVCVENGKPKSEGWMRKLFSFNTDPVAPNMLIGWITGEEAEFMETLSDLEVKDMCVQVLRRFMNNENIPSPKEFYRSKWHSNLYTRGSYSHIAIGATVEDIRNLAKPIIVDGKLRVCFAGEATHECYYSTTLGAFKSGQREAERISDSVQ